MGWTPIPEDYIDDVQGGFYDKNGFFVVGEKNNEVVASAGFIGLTPTTILLKRFYVDSTYRGQGLAQQLLEYVLSVLKEKGYQVLFLDVDVDNPRAKRFYEKEGFAKCSVKPNPMWWESKEPDKHYFYKKDI